MIGLLLGDPDHRENLLFGDERPHAFEIGLSAPVVGFGLCNVGLGGGDPGRPRLPGRHLGPLVFRLRRRHLRRRSGGSARGGRPR